MIQDHISDEVRDRYTENGYWGNPTTLDLWDRNARLYPDQEAVVDSRKRLTWGQCKKWYDRVALGFLELGLKKDDVVVSQLPNMVETLLLMRALEEAGVLNLPVMTTLRHSEVGYLMKRVSARGIVIAAKYRNFDYCQMVWDLRSELPDLEFVFTVGQKTPDGTISLNEMSKRPLEEKYPSDYLYATRIGPYEVKTLRTTSGTTGEPKIIEYMNQDWLVGKTDADRWKMTGDDIVLALAPVVGGPGGGPAHWSAPHVAAKVVMIEKFDPEEALRLIEKERATLAAGVPAQAMRMVRHPDLDKYDLGSLRIFTSSGAPCPYSLAREVEERMGCKVVCFLGAQDIGRITSASYDDPPEVRWYSVGKTYPGNEVRLVDDDCRDMGVGEIGEIIWRGPTVLGSYYRDLHRTMEVRGGAVDGFVRMGDLAKFDAEGNLYVVDRKKDVIIRGGQNISPTEIETLLITHPKVVNAAVVPMPDPVMGEKACAYVILKEDAIFEFDEMISFLKEKKIAPYKLPERLEVLDRFPMAGDGTKVVKKELAQDIARKLEAEPKG